VEELINRIGNNEKARRENDPNGEITDFRNKKKFLKRARDNTKNENEGQMNI
jgi:hypothetical protein